MKTILQKYFLPFIGLCLLLSTTACYPTRYLKPNEYLLKSEPKVKGNKSLSYGKVSPAVKTKANRKVLNSPVYLNLHNLGLRIEEDSSFIKKLFVKKKEREESLNKLVDWLKNKIGEQPEVVNLNALKRDSANLRSIYFGEGFFYPDISIAIDTQKGFPFTRIADAYLIVDENVPFTIGQIEPNIKSSGVFDVYLRNQKFSELKEGDNYNHKNMARERGRITELMRDNGYFTFSQKMVSYTIDTTWVNPEFVDSTKEKSLKITVNIEEAPVRYKIKNIRVKLTGPGDDLTIAYDTIRGDNYSLSQLEALGIREKVIDEHVKLTYVVSHSLADRINYNFIGKRVHLRERGYYSQKDARTTQRRLQELGMLQFAAINYNIVDSVGEIDVLIDLQFAQKYQLKLGAEAFTNDIRSPTTLPAIGANFGLRNKNAFRHSELLQFSISGNLGWYTPDENSRRQIYDEIFAQADINFPRFLLPFRIGSNLLGANPFTTFSGTFRTENRMEYTRTTTGLNLTYKWNHIPFKTREYSQVSPLAIDFILLPTIDPDFQSIVAEQPATIQREFEPRFSSRMKWVYTNTEYGTTRERPTTFFRSTIELGGNLPYLFELIGVSDSSRTDNLLFDDLFFGQYVKTSVEGKYFVPLYDGGELVLRGLMGFSIGYNHTDIVPPESRFFSGGTNSLRGWQSNTVGPGTLALDSIGTVASNLLAPGGEILMEMNAELRFDVLSYLELAIFTDAGNVWFNRRDLARTEVGEEAVLSRENFKLGWDFGVGFRFDFSFLILRLDVGQQLYAPDRGWVIRGLNQGWGGQNAQLNLGIGYPF